MAKKLSPIDQKASKDVLGDLRKLAQGEMKGKMDSLKKVTVSSDSKQGLKKGLEKAEEILGDEGEECSICGSKECTSHEMDESPEYEQEEESEEIDSPELSPEEIDAKIQELMQLKAKLQK